MAAERSPGLEIAFPVNDTKLRLVFSHPTTVESVVDPAGYDCRSGLEVLGAEVDGDSRRVTLTTEPMNGEVMQLDTITAPDARTRDGAKFERTSSPEFVHGIVSIPELLRPAENQFPFPSRVLGRIASASCGKDGGVDSNRLVSQFGFAFVHNEAGGPFNSVKIVTDKHIRGIVEAVSRLSAGLTVHVLWAGGEVRDAEGETQLVDTGFMEGSIFPPNPLKSPPAFAISASEVAGEGGRSLRAKSLHGVVVRFANVTIERVTSDGSGLRRVSFHDASGGRLDAVLLDSVTTELAEGQELQSLRALLHQPQAGSCEAIVELDQHIVLSRAQLFGHVTVVAGQAGPGFAGCQAVLALRDRPGELVAVVTSEHRLQTLLETALANNRLVACWGEALTRAPTPPGGPWTTDVYGIDSVTLFDRA